MFANPTSNVAKLGLQEGMKVADFGAGTGFYSRAASHKVGHTGRVYAIEVQKEMVKKLESDLKEWNISNVHCIWGDIETNGGTKLADGSMDAVIISNVLFQSSDRLGLVDEAKRVLKSHGKVLLIDWKEASGMGPSANHVVNEEKATGLFTNRGFKKIESIAESDHHYGILFEVKE